MGYNYYWHYITLHSYDIWQLQCIYHVCKWSICANSWSRNATIVSCCWWQLLHTQSAKDRVQGAKVRTSTSASLRGMQQQHATPPTTATDQIRISTGASGVLVRCSNHCNLRKGTHFQFLPCPAVMQVAMVAPHRALHQHWCWSWAGRWWWWYIYQYSTYWHRHCTCTGATCTVRWYIHIYIERERERLCPESGG